MGYTQEQLIEAQCHRFYAQGGTEFTDSLAERRHDPRYAKVVGEATVAAEVTPLPELPDELLR